MLCPIMAVSCQETDRVPGWQRTSLRGRIDFERSGEVYIPRSSKQENELRTQGREKLILLTSTETSWEEHIQENYTHSDGDRLFHCVLYYFLGVLLLFCCVFSLVSLRYNTSFTHVSAGVTPEPIFSNLFPQISGSCTSEIQKVPKEQLSLCQLSAGVV